MGTVKDTKFYGDLTRALSYTPYQNLQTGQVGTRSLIIKALDDEILKAVYITMVTMPSSGTTQREFIKVWTDEATDILSKGLENLAKQYLEVTGGDKSPTFEVDTASIQTSLEIIGYRAYNTKNSGLWRFECQIRVTPPANYDHDLNTKSSLRSL